MTLSPEHAGKVMANHQQKMMSSTSLTTVTDSLVNKWNIQEGPANIFAEAMVGRRDHALNIIAGNFKEPTAANDNNPAEAKIAA